MQWLFGTMLAILAVASEGKAQGVPADQELNSYIEYLAGSVHNTEVNYQLVLENAAYLLKASHYTYNNYLDKNAPLPEEGIDKRSFMHKRFSEMSALQVQYKDYNLKHKGMQVPKSLAPTLQEYITVSNTVIYQMNETAGGAEIVSNGQYELIGKLWAAHVARGLKPEIKTPINPDLRSVSPVEWDNEQKAIKTGLSRHRDLYLKLVRMIEKMEAVAFDPTFVIANQKLIREDIEKKEAEAMAKKRAELENVKLARIFSKDRKVFPFREGYYHGGIGVDCRNLGSYERGIQSKGFDPAVIGKMKTICGLFSEGTSKAVLERMVGYYITDVRDNNGENQKSLIWIPKDENAFLEKDGRIFDDEDGFIMLGTPMIRVTGKLNQPEGNKDSLLIGRLFRNTENSCTLPYTGKLEKVTGAYETEIRYYLKTLAGDNPVLDTLFRYYMSNASMPPCILDINAYHDPKDKKKKNTYPKDCSSKIYSLNAYRLLQFNKRREGTFELDFFDLYWIPGDENQAKDPDVKPLTADGYLILTKGNNRGHFVESLKRNIY